MKLSDFDIDTLPVELSFKGRDGKPAEVEVRALTTHDLITMMGTHAPALAVAFGSLMQTARTKQTITPQDVEKMMGILLVSAPDFMGDLIALLNDDDTPKGRSNAKRLNVVDQLAILNGAATITLRSEAHLKKLIEAARPTIESIFGAMAAVRGSAPSKSSRNGIGASAGRLAS